jgi:Protein of unknown function (DUF2752)
MGGTPLVAGSHPRPEHLAAGILSAGALCAVSAGALGGDDLSDGPVLCPFRLTTGLPCPFCGTTRSLVALGGGDLGEALSLQPFGPLVAVGAVAVLVAVFSASARRLVWKARYVRVALVVVALTWAVQLGRVAAG